jgi:hypothetical protein
MTVLPSSTDRTRLNTIKVFKIKKGELGVKRQMRVNGDEMKGDG